MKRFIDIITDSLMETNDPLEGLSYAPQELPITKEIPVSKSDPVTDTQVNHIETQKKHILDELEKQIEVVKQHIGERSFHSAKLALEALETLEQQARDLEVELAKLHQKASESNENGSAN